MPSRQDWGNAFLRCAQEDLDAAKALLRLDAAQVPYAALAMLFQMTFEKIGKSYLYKHSNQPGEKIKNHAAATKALSRMKSTRPAAWPALASLFQPRNSEALCIVEELEASQPANSDRIFNLTGRRTGHLEFPWESLGTIKIPSADLPVVQKLRSTPQVLMHLVKLADFLIKSI